MPPRPTDWVVWSRQAPDDWRFPFYYAEWCLEMLAFRLGNLGAISVLEYFGRLTIVVAMISYAISYEDEKAKQAAERVKQARQSEYLAWGVINSAVGQASSSGRIHALQDLTAIGVPLDGIDVHRAWLQEINLRGAIMRRADFRGADLRAADFLGAKLREARFGAYEGEETNLAQAEFRNSELKNSDFSLANLLEADFRGAKLIEVTFDGADLRQAKFDADSTAVGARFNCLPAARCSNLRDARLQESTMNYSDFTGADLTGADFARAKLRQVILTDANLTGAHFEGADLSGAEVSIDQLNLACLDGETVLDEEMRPASQLRPPSCDGDWTHLD